MGVTFHDIIFPVPVHSLPHPCLESTKCTRSTLYIKGQATVKAAMARRSIDKQLLSNYLRHADGHNKVSSISQIHDFPVWGALPLCEGTGIPD